MTSIMKKQKLLNALHSSFVFRSLSLLFVLSFSVLQTNAQVFKTEEVEQFSIEKYGDDWVEQAEYLTEFIELDKNNRLSFSRVIQCGRKDAEKLYELLNDWFTKTFSDKKSEIMTNSKAERLIIARGYLDDMADHVGGVNRYIVGIHPLIRVDIKDKRIKVHFLLSNYDVKKASGGGLISKISGKDGSPNNYDGKWMFENTYPFNPNDSHRKTSAQAFVMTHIYSQMIFDKIEEIVNDGIVGFEDDDNW